MNPLPKSPPDSPSNLPPDSPDLPAEPPPAETALAQLERLTSAGASPDRVTQLIGHIVAAWADEPDMHPATAHARVQHMWDAVSRNAADLQEQIADFDSPDKAALTAACRTLAALQAAETILTTTLDRL